MHYSWNSDACDLEILTTCLKKSGQPWSQSFEGLLCLIEGTLVPLHTYILIFCESTFTALAIFNIIASFTIIYIYIFLSFQRPVYYWIHIGIKAYVIDYNKCSLRRMWLFIFLSRTMFFLFVYFVFFLSRTSRFFFLPTAHLFIVVTRN